MHRGLEFDQSQWLKPYIEFNTQQRIEVEKNNDKDGKALYKLMNNEINRKTMENVRNRINVKPSKQRKSPFKMYIKTKLCVVQSIVKQKCKVALKLNKPAYIRMYILEFSVNLRIPL